MSGSGVVLLKALPMHAGPKEGLQKSFLRTRHPIKSMAYVLFIGEKLSFAEVS